MIMVAEDYEQFIQAIATLARLRAKWTPTISGDWIMRDYSLALDLGADAYLEQSRAAREAVLQKIKEHKLPMDKFA